MNKCKINSLVIALVLLVPCLAFALPGAHDPASGNGFACNSCHIAPASMGHIDSNYATNVCLRCHSTGGILAGKTAKNFAPEDYANPFKTTSLPRGSALQTSHKWFGTDTVPAAGAVAPVDTSLNGLNKSANFQGTLFCARCHNVHGTSGSASVSTPYLRYPNDADQLCLNCHRPRDTKSHTLGTHPVNVSYTSASVKAKILAGDLLSAPVANPGNPTGAVKLVNNKVVCSTCHRMHNTDSRTSTFDPYSTTQTFGQLSSSKGYLLRVDAYGKTGSDVNICTNCHAAKLNHNLSLRSGKAAVQCNDCHSGHVEYDAAAVGGETTPNINLVRRYLQYTTAGRLSKRIIYNSSTTKNFYSATGGGVCQSCHTPPLDHFSAGTTIEAGHVDCASCHNHNDATGAFSVSAGGCTSCHGQPPTTTAAGGPTGKAGTYVTYDESLTPHASHAGGTQYSFSCTECHKGNTHNSGNTYTDVFVSTVGIKAGASATYSSPTCTNVYCHSSGNGTYKGGVNTVAWGNNKGSIIGQATECTTCHDSSTYSTSHAKHITTMGYGCATCHGATVSNNTTLLAASKLSGGTHVNAAKDVQFSEVLPATRLTGSGANADCTNLYCHSNGKGTAAITPPNWATGTGGACGACHLTTTLTSGAHGEHISYIGGTDPLVLCAKCHTYTGDTAATHVNGTIEKPDTNCTNACHIDVYSSTANNMTLVNWAAKTPANCAACHTGTGAFTGTGSAPATGSHNIHMAVSGTTCASCHTGATTTAYNSASHLDGNIDVSAGGYTANVAKHTAVSGYGGRTCSTATCHASAYGTGFATTPVWGATSGCASCHNTSLGAAAAFDATYGAPTTGAHNMHVSVAVTCASCHANVAKDSNTSVLHKDGSINVTGYAAPIAKHTIGTGYTSTCSVVCHGSSTPTWGAITTNNACTKCHGTPTVGTIDGTNRDVVAPIGGTLTGTGQVSNNVKVGAHKTHLKFLNGFSNYSTIDYRCESCHGTLPNSGNYAHAGGSSSPQGKFQNLATKWGALTPTYSGTTCSNVYCHNPSASGTLTDAGSAVTPSWTDATLLADGGKSLANCGKCHKVPGDAGFSKQAVHGAMVTDASANQCSGCHGHDGNAAGTIGQRHMDGIRYAGGGTSCDGCHDYDTVGTTTKTWGLARNANYGTFNQGNGAHAVHVEYLKTRWGGLALDPSADYTVGYGLGNAAKICGTCHTNTLGNHMDTARLINFGDGTSVVGTSSQALLFNATGTPLSSAYTGSSATQSSAQAKTCSNISCHYFTSPNWSTY